MTEDQSFAQLFDRLRSGDEAAAEDIFNKFARRLIGLARARLTGRVRVKVDPEDIVQSVFRSFFMHQAERQYTFSGWDDLWGLLALITLRKCGHCVDHYRAARRDVTREAEPARPANDSVATWEPIARDPSPSEAAMLIEVLDDLMRGLDERNRRILELSLQGESVARISEQLGCSERTVERVLERIRKHLEQVSTA